MRRVRIIGPGRAGSSLAAALGRCGWFVGPLLGRHDDVSSAAEGVDLLVVATPDRVVAEVAASVDTDTDTVVAHLSGALGLEALAPHVRRAACHPLVSLADADRAETARRHAERGPRQAMEWLQRKLRGG